MSDKHITDFVPFATHYWVSTLVFNGLYSIFVLVSLSFETAATWHWLTLGIHFTTLYKVFTLQKRLRVHLQTTPNWSKRLPWFGSVSKLTQTPFVLTSFYTKLIVSLKSLVSAYVKPGRIFMLWLLHSLIAPFPLLPFHDYLSGSEARHWLVAHTSSLV